MRLASLRYELRSNRETRYAGAAPNIRAVRDVIRIVKSRTLQSTLVTSKVESQSGARRLKAPITQPVARYPVMPPKSASTKLSLNICATSRPRLAPSDARTVISPARDPNLESRRLATFAQAMSSTKPTAEQQAHDFSGIFEKPVAHTLYPHTCVLVRF